MQRSAASRGFGKHSGTLKRKRWGGLRRRWELLGLFEIDQHHQFYSLTCMMKEGLSASIQTTVDHASTNQLLEADFRAEDTRVHEGFTLETFAGPVFSNLRGSLGVTELEYQQSLCSDKCYLQFISNSKSKADFFLTNDKRFFLKTQNEREIRFLLDNLKNYMAHLRKYPHSLLVKLLGVHRIKISRRQKKYFIVMQSVFYPDDRISARYDIKGCEVSRWTDPSPDGCQIIVVLKDLNFEGQYVTLDRQRPWLLRQMEIDTDFLRSLNVLDYSLLLAHQPLQQDERHHALSFASLIARTKRSVNPSTSPACNIPAVPGAVPEDNSVFISSDTDSDSLKRGQTGDGRSGDAHHRTEELPDFEVQNRRLLLNFKNALHVIDGPDQRYFIGIIDIFTVYSLKKRLEYWWKRLRHPGRTFSTVSPQTYCARLCQWVLEHTK
ncbi:phosphatidylinositol 4-phosphate 5-kinase-like protein 1 isoform X2 [Phyllopteryx taeniolatus]|uniref:phosphatidylinositol 4-phosphate 5-kinase-like protein 1 isoform X2 n=1 Tax=Phyllopteryx taeniolatus TaxID=161469 RepID=UPI002AD372BD|nr:phosphatidylinositol 4-phosphate 5-kinase-like protein 1 isoform X2 [Phyllopteryx taeniolatus]XP_061656351.1 phosphatidylinositol 4-phosphate 5-kinase-like protein 1 isoform X2 [Phyllopteryx taeniolatus]